MRLLRKLGRVIGITSVTEVPISWYINFRRSNRKSFFESGLFSITENDLQTIYGELKNLDSKLAERKGFGETRFWQLLLDQDKMPGSKPPWGMLTAINLNSQKIMWQVPFGQEHDANRNRIHPGARNFGGTIVTQSDLIFATGTTDGFARAYSLGDGRELWKDKLPYAGSSPPMTYSYEGCQYVIFNASGGKFVGFTNNPGDATVAYRLPSCLTSAQ